MKNRNFWVGQAPRLSRSGASPERNIAARPNPPGNSESSARSILLLTLALLFFVGCRGVRRGEPITGPLDFSTPKIQRGQIVFAQHCHQCHPGGEGGLGPGLNDKPAPVWLMKTQVRLGLGVMPAFDDETIPAEELDALMAYVIALRKDD